jgi:hypothetical protein
MRKALIIAVAIILFFLGAAMALVAAFAQDFIEKYRHDIAGLALQMDEVDIKWFTYSVIMNGVNIYPAGKENKAHLLASAEKIQIRILPYDLFRRMIHIHNLTLTKPKVNYIRTSMRHTNWEALNMSWLKGGQEDRFGGWRLKVDQVKIENGRVIWRDGVTGGRLEFRQMYAEVSNIEDEPNPKRLPNKIKVDAKLSKYDAPVRIRGRANLLAEGLNLNLNSSIQNAPITYFSPFYAGQVPFKIIAGKIGIKSRINIFKSYLKSTHHAAIRNLKVGGLKGKLINPLFLKNKVVYATAVVNGDLEKGNLRVSSQVSRIIGNSILADAKKISPVHKVGGSIKRAGQKTGDAVKRLFKR